MIPFLCPNCRLPVDVQVTIPATDTHGPGFACPQCDYRCDPEPYDPGVCDVCGKKATRFTMDLAWTMPCHKDGVLWETFRPHGEKRRFCVQHFRHGSITARDFTEGDIRRLCEQHDLNFEVNWAYFSNLEWVNSQRDEAWTRFEAEENCRENGKPYHE
jgi:hypothetical protein